MGKFLSCLKTQNISSTFVNEPTNTPKSNTDLPNSNTTELELQKVSGHTSYSSTSNSNVINGLYRRVHANKSTSNHNENSEDIIAIEDRLKKPLIINRTKHFSPFFQTKILSAGENDVKTKQRTDALFESKINALFEKYRDADEKDMISMDGVEKLCNDLDLQPDDFKILILAWKFNAEQMCQFTRQEFVSGCKEMKTENLSQMRNELSEIAATLKNDHPQFKNLYRFTFKFGLDKTIGQRILPKDMAICLWKLVFTLHKPPILDRWLPFLQSDQAHIRGIPRDTWNMFLNFSETVGNDLSSYDDAEAWPSIFDDFVEYEKDRLNQNLIISNSAVSQLDSYSKKPKETVR